MKQFKHLLFISILCSLVLFTNCGEEDAAAIADELENAEYTLTVEVSPTEGGAVSYQSGPFLVGTKVTLTATANTNYAFKEWTGAFNGTTNPMELIMNANNTVTAVFELLDTDGDGVTDDIDACQSTPQGETANEVGCSPSQTDTDGDGITDDLDTCAETAEDNTVDENGCADYQRDTDGDGVTDDLDTCANTPEGATVDANGCADSQKDTDSDGVTDDLDTCADTPEGLEVDYYGCDASQRDTDDDGVTDDLDICADTPEGYEIDQNGCIANPAKIQTAVILYAPLGDMKSQTFYSIENNQTYSMDDVNSTTDPVAAYIDFGYYYGSIDSATLASPYEYTIYDLSAWEAKNATTLAVTTITSAEYLEMVTVSDIETALAGVDVNDANGTVTNLSANDILMFKTVDNVQGLIHVSAITGTDGSDGMIKLEMKLAASE